MRMSLMFAAVTLLTGINLFFIPFQPVPALWGAILAVAFVLINVVADKLRLWSGIAWIIVAGIIITLMLKGKEPGDELRGLITVFAFLASAWYCVVQYRKEKGESRHCCKVSDEAAFCLIQRPYISKTLLTRRISPRGSP
ncbi:hypothetical protein [Klebsiella pneumoniae]|nr:hypothetical protein [Klebsiella pneumoniae]VGB98933.1 Uncharacterised protein [Klebsiella pneumoniae]